MVTRRGANLGLNKHPDDVAKLLATGCNHIRWQIHIDPSLDWHNYRLAVSTQVLELRDRINEIIPKANVTLALMTPPCGDKFWKSQELQKKLPELWVDIAGIMKRVPGILGFDLLNEPRLTTARWRELAERTIRRIKAIDPKRRCIVSSRKGEPGELGALGKVEGADLYTVHFYSPMSYTHQGVLPGYAAPKKLPAEEPRKALATMQRLAASVNKPLYVGEFSCACGSPQEDTWLVEVTRHLLRNKIHGAYHAWKEAEVWSHDSSPSRERVLLRYFGGGA